VFNYRMSREALAAFVIAALMGGCAQKVDISDVTSTYQSCENVSDEECQAEEPSSREPNAYLRVTFNSDADFPTIAKRLEIPQLYGIVEACGKEPDLRRTTYFIANSDKPHSVVFRIFALRHIDVRDVLVDPHGGPDTEDVEVCFSIGGGSMWARLQSNTVPLFK